MNHANTISRRTLLSALAAASVPLVQPSAARAGIQHHPLASKRLISITLTGGNDGLNTVVPVKDPLYRRLRPTLALPEAKCLPIGDGLALHPAMVQMRAMYEAGEMAIVQDVGYPEPNLSHFFSSDVWNAGETDPALMNVGWYARVVADNRDLFSAQDFDVQAMLFSISAHIGVGSGVRGFPSALMHPGEAVQVPAVPKVPAGSGRLVRSLAEDREAQRDMSQRIARRLAGQSVPSVRLDEDALLQQIQLAIFSLSKGIQVPLLRLEQEGFDFHSRQLPDQADRLATLDKGLARLRTALKSEGLWNDTVVLVHSEFGRRVKQNGYDGTDHGTAGPALLFGAGVAGGLYGQRPVLDQLDANGNLRYGTDFRSLYATVLGQLWQLPNNRPAQAGFLPLNMIRAI